MVKADGNYTPYTSDPDALVNWEFIEQIVRKESCFNRMCVKIHLVGIYSLCVNPFPNFLLAFAELRSVVVSNLPVPPSCCEDDTLWPCLLLALYPPLFGPVG